MKKQLLSMLLCGSLLAALTGCGGGTTSSAAFSGSSAAVPVEPSAPIQSAEAKNSAAPVASIQESIQEEPEISVSYPLTDSGYTFTCWTTYGPGMEDYLSQIGTFPVFQKAQEVTGVGIEFIPCDQSTQPEKLNLYVASGSMPDVMLSMSSLYSTGGEGLINDEVAYDLNEFMDLMPNYARYIDELDDKTRSNLYTDSGYLPAILTLGAQENVGLNIRQDWLDELGMEIPETYDELENVLLAFKNKYGCRNALYMLQDYGYTNNALASGYDTQVSAAMNGLHFYQVDGKVMSGDFNGSARRISSPIPIRPMRRIRTSRRRRWQMWARNRVRCSTSMALAGGWKVSPAGLSPPAAPSRSWYASIWTGSSPRKVGWRQTGAPRA